MFPNRKFLGFIVPVLMYTLLFGSCASDKPKKEEVLYNQYCASCHLAPKIDELPKNIWENSILPDMLSRMEVEEMYQDPNDIHTGLRPKIKLQDWVVLKDYIIDLAPTKLPVIKIPHLQRLEQFQSKPLELDDEYGALITYMESDGQQLFFGDVAGTLKSYNFNSNTSILHYQGRTPVTWFNTLDSIDIVTEVGILDPSELKQGMIIQNRGDDTLNLSDQLHRPVHTLMKDLNKDGKQELVVSEFGNETGQLSLLIQNDSLSFEKKVLLNQPGCVRTLARDMNNDGRTDLITMTTQGMESITILYQEDGLKFRADKVLQFRSIFGSSWFELVDYNGDGFDDIITVNGDNADKSYVHKAYHGMRIHLNDGENNFKETYFYPLNGATRVVVRDFDQDGDFDFGLISTFPDYDRAPELSFVYLENSNSQNYEFSTKVLTDPGQGRWFLMDAADIDADGDEDIILSSFTYVFTPVPENLSKRWSESNVDVLILKNLLN